MTADLKPVTLAGRGYWLYAKPTTAGYWCDPTKPMTGDPARCAADARLAKLAGTQAATETTNHQGGGARWRPPLVDEGGEAA